MQDIRKPGSHSRSKININHDLNFRVEEFEKGVYEDDSVKNRVNFNKNIEKGRRITDGIDIYPKRYEDVLVYTNKSRVRTSHKDKRNTYIFIFLVFVIVIVVALLTFVFDKATIKFNPKNEYVDINKVYTFTDSITDNSINFSLATTTISKSKSLSLSDTKKVESKASGRIIVYNNFDSSPQKLIKNTRFESSNGKVFRLSDSVIIPGKVGDTPGSLEVTVYADSYGADYNLSPTDFTIPGFKGSARYKSFFARSNGAMTGGASGNTTIVSVSDLNAAKDELTLELIKDIKDKLKSVNREGYLALYDNIQIKFEDNDQEIRTGVSSNYSIKATGYLVLADKSNIAKNIALTLRDYKNEEVKLSEENNLHFSLKDIIDLSKDSKFEVLIEGKTRIIWVINEQTISGLLSGKDSGEFKNILKGIPSIEKAEVSFSPMWLNTFPTNKESIKFIENINTK